MVEPGGFMRFSLLMMAAMIFSFSSSPAHAQTASEPAATTAAPTATPATPAAPAPAVAAPAPAVKEPNNVQLENTLYVELKDGRVVILMRPDLAPNHVARIKELVRQKFYDGVAFHRVMDGFMAQTGDPTGTGRGGSGKKLDPEFSREKHVRGVVSMARGASLDSADSQWFIMFSDAPHLDGQYTVWGQVLEGMQYVDAIKKSDDPVTGTVSMPDKIITMRLAVDNEAAKAGATVAPTASDVPPALPVDAVDDSKKPSVENAKPKAPEATTSQVKQSDKVEADTTMPVTPDVTLTPPDSTAQ
jgi:peptidylprolyl isomerase